MPETQSCPSVNSHGQELRWKFTEPLGSCIYTVYDEMSFIFGWISVLAWTFALLPQIISNFVNQSAESQSFWFWLLWLIGDFCNLTGCFLTDNLITNIALAFVYLGFTAIAFVQFVYYEFILPKVRNAPIVHTQTHPVHTLYQSPSQRTQLVKQDMSPDLRAALKIAHGSPRMFNVNMNLTPKARNELENLLVQQEESAKPNSAKRRANAQNTAYSNDGRTVMTRRVIHGNIDDTRQSNSDILTSVKMPGGISDMLRASSADVVPGPHLTIPENSPSTSAQFQLPSPALRGMPIASTNSNEYISLQQQQQRKEVHVIARSHIQDSGSYDGDTKESSQQSNKQTTLKNGVLFSIGIMFLWFNFINVASGDEDQSQSQPQPQPKPQSQRTHEIQQAMNDIGLILGWVCTVIYISSRVPQLKLMLSQQNANGLNPLFFCLTLTGNLTQFISMLVLPSTYHDVDIFLKMLPWLISSGICMLQDSFILLLVFLYQSRSRYLPLKTTNHQNYNATDTMPLKGEK